jgi:hypothetical protein
VNAVALASAAHTATPWFIAFVENYWWLLLLFGGGILEWIGETFNCGLSALVEWSEIRHERKLELARARAAAEPPPSPATLPAAPCRHRNVVSVRDRTETVVAWLCKGCDARLPADFSVYEEDL